jgi:tight adherence protein C
VDQWNALLPYLPFVLGGIAVIIALALIAVGISNANQVDPLAERLADYAGQADAVSNLEDIEMSVPFSQRVILPIMQAIAKFTTQFTPQQTLEKTQLLLNLAGNPRGLTPGVFWAMRFGALIGLGIIFLIMMAPRGPIYTIGGGLFGAVLGYLMPQMWLQSQCTRRQQAIIKALPDALDLMSICVEAGLGFDQAMGKVHEKWTNELALSFGRVLREIQLGKTRREALKSMDESMGVADVTAFCSAIIQADQLGVSISKVLKIQSEQMRIKRRQRAQEKAQQAPIKMMIPMVLLIFPAIWLVLLGPAGVQVYKQFYGSGQ